LLEDLGDVGRPDEILYVYENDFLPPMTLGRQVEHDLEFEYNLRHAYEIYRVNDAYIMNNELNGFYKEAYALN
jgi:hypothetical protein